MKLEVRNLNTFFEDTQILKNVNMDVPENSVTALIGPSGCGKSTFIRTVNRMNDLIPTFSHDGNISLDGVDVYDDAVDVVDLRKKVGMVFQKPNPFPMSVYDNITYGPRIHGEEDEDYIAQVVEESLKSAAIWDEVKDKLDKSAMGLSGGQQQRLCIARCIAMNPKVILMDEPTSALDPIATLKIEELMEDLKKDFTIIIVTHNMQQATRISDYTAFFMLGEIIEYAPTEKLFKDPQNKKTEDYITGRFG